MTLANGSVFAGYRIIRLLGEGGMGAVYLAQHPRLPRHDALKTLSGGLTSDPAFRARFEREADIVARMRHPNIVAVYDRGAEDDQLWISMQYVEGTDAAHLIKAGPGVLTIPRVIDILRDVAKALDYAHRHGLLHRDVKPANILVTPPVDQYGRESALLTDFGIARAMTDAAQGLTLPGDMIGTVAYAAPEQLAGGQVDHRVDVYALGCTLYEMLTGSKPYATDSMPAMVHAHLTAPPPRPTQARPGLPPALDGVMARALAKDPNHRYNSCHELIEDAARALGIGPQFASGPLTAVTTPPSAGRSHRPLILGGVALAAVAVIAIVVIVVALQSNTGGGTTATTTSTSATTTTSPTRPAGSTAEASDGSFVVNLPTGWHSEKPTGLLKLLDNQAEANILVSTNSDRGTTVQDSAMIGAKQITDQLGGVIDAGGFEATSVDGEQAYRFTYNLPPKPGEYPAARGRQLYVRHGGVEYIVTFTGSPEAFNSQVANYESVMDSWKWST